MSLFALLSATLGYGLLLFVLAQWAERRANQGRSVINHPVIYSLSIAVYCTAWTFFGSVGLASTAGLAFLPIYLGPTLAALLFPLLLTRLIAISRAQHLTSIADWLSARYGQSAALGALATVVLALGITPYLAIQLKAIAHSFVVLAHNDMQATPSLAVGFVAGVVLAIFAILFGTRRLDGTERHEGLVAAVAAESLVKLVAFVALGLFASVGLLQALSTTPELPFPPTTLLIGDPTAEGHSGYLAWFSLNVLSFAAFFCLPRQFQVLVVEGRVEHVPTATWLFPLYLLLINLFVLPIAWAGQLFLPADTPADLFVLALPLAQGHPELALLVFIGGLSAATGMVIVETVALATMMSNSLVLPWLITHRHRHPALQGDLTGVVLLIRRLAIGLLIALGYFHFAVLGDAYALVAMGLISFVAAAQLAPALLIGLLWSGARCRGAIWGLSGGFVIWIYTLLLPAFARSGWLPMSFITEGPGGIAWLKPYALLGLEGLDVYTHTLIWSGLVNIGGLILGSLWGDDRARQRERLAARQFLATTPTAVLMPQAEAITVGALSQELSRFLGADRTQALFQELQAPEATTIAPSELLHRAEQRLAGAVGAAAARIAMGMLVPQSQPQWREVQEMLDESAQVRAYSRELEARSQELAQATQELRDANAQLQQLDRLKDEFISTVTHELRTPLTSIRAFSDILLANPTLPQEQRHTFLAIVAKESDRLTRLINQVLDLAKLESGQFQLQCQAVDLAALVDDAINSTGQLFRDGQIRLIHQLAAPMPFWGDSDRLTQVVVNLLSNAAKFCPTDGEVTVSLALDPNTQAIRLTVRDTGPGIPTDQQAQIFEKFHQVQDIQRGKPAGTGLGLPICAHIVAAHGGKIGVHSQSGEGATFWVELPPKAPLCGDITPCP